MDHMPMPHEYKRLGENVWSGDSSGRCIMKKAICALPLIALAGPALAEDIELTPIIEARLRYENAEQAGVATESDALTMRLRAGVVVKKGPIAILAEGEGTLAIVENYNSGLNGKPGPIIADPQNIDLNRAQLQFTGLPKTSITVGRQRINLDDQRFVGGVAWRQNEQTYDAARIEWNGIKGIKADVSYAWGVRTIWGVDGSGTRQQAISGDNILANLGYKGKNWGATAFAYLVDQDEAVVQGFRLSSKTYGIRLNGTIPIGKAKLAMIASYAKQSDFNKNPNNYSSDYWLGEATLDFSGFKLASGYEVLGADNGAAFSSFQTPLATLHKFNGTADKFLTTPPNGLRDFYLGMTKPIKFKALPGFTAAVTWHKYTSDRLDLDYGTEWNAQMGWKIGKKMSFLAKYANYDRKGAADFAGDAGTEKFWAQLEYVF
jgi:Alginate export